MHADLKWLAENVSEWGGTYSFKHIFLEDGRADYSSAPDDVVLRTFTRAQWQAARDELFTQRAAQRQRPKIKTQVTAWHAAEDEILASEMSGAEPCPEDPFASPEEDEAWAEAEDRIDAIGHNVAWAEDERRMNAMNSTYNHWQHLTDDITAYDPPGPTSIPECTFTTPDEKEAWREVEKKINPVWQSPHDAGGVCVFHGCRYSAHEQCYMCVLAGEAAKEEAKQPAYNPEDVAGVHSEAKQPRYQDTAGEDWIDEAARTFTAEEFRGAMRFTIGKYNRRMGKKDDLISEIEKIRDYATRWLEVEQGQ